MESSPVKFIDAFCACKKSSILTPFILYHPLRILTITIPCVPSQKCPEVWWTWYDFVTLWLAVAGLLQGSYSSCGEFFILLLSPAKTVADLCRMQMWKSSVQNQAISNNTYQANIIRYYKQSIHFSTWTCGTLAAYYNLAIVHMCILSCAKSP